MPRRNRRVHSAWGPSAPISCEILPRLPFACTMLTAGAFSNRQLRRPSSGSGGWTRSRLRIASPSVNRRSDGQMSCTTSAVSSPMLPLATIRPVSRIANFWVIRANEIQILLDQENRAIALRRDALDDRLDLFDDRRLQSFGRLVHQQQLRLLHQRPRDCELLLLAARQRAAFLADQRRFKRREVVEDETRDFAGLCDPCRAARHRCSPRP